MSTSVPLIEMSATASTPEVRCTPAPNRIFMRGDAYPENAFELFNPILQWAEQVLAIGDAELQVELELAYLNTSSVRTMMELFDVLEAAHQRGQRVAVAWYYHPRNARIADLAEEFKEDLSLPFVIEARDG